MLAVSTNRKEPPLVPGKGLTFSIVSLVTFLDSSRCRTRKSACRKRYIIEDCSLAVGTIAMLTIQVCRRRTMSTCYSPTPSPSDNSWSSSPRLRRWVVAAVAPFPGSAAGAVEPLAVVAAAAAVA